MNHAESLSALSPLNDCTHALAPHVPLGVSLSGTTTHAAARSDSLFDLDTIEKVGIGGSIFLPAAQTWPTDVSPARLVDLPLDLLAQVLLRLPPSDLLQCAVACHTLYSPAVARLHTHPHIQSLPNLQRFLASLTIANQNAARRSEAPWLVRRLTLTIPLADLASDELAQLGAQCPNLQSLLVVDSNWSGGAGGWYSSGRIVSPTSGPLATFKLESLVSLTPQLMHLSLTGIDSLDMAHLITHLATHCPLLTSLTLEGCQPSPKAVVTWRSAVLALRRLSLTSLAIRGGPGRCFEECSTLLHNLHCPSLQSLTMTDFFQPVPFASDAASLLASMLSRHPQLTHLRLQGLSAWKQPGKMASIFDLDWVADAILQVWQVPMGQRGPRRRVALRQVSGTNLDTVQNIASRCDGVLVEYEP